MALNNEVSVRIKVQCAGQLPGAVIKLVQRGKAAEFTWFSIKGFGPDAPGCQVFLNNHEFDVVKGELQ